jgi:SAM-dependent methyltransferase
MDQIVFPAVLDACCGPRMMWFDKADPRALFIDKRQEIVPRDWTNDGRSAGRNPAVVAPDIIADFTAMPFPDESFHLVVFDPPHVGLSRTGVNGKFRKLYGVLPVDWVEVLRGGFAECFRVLRPHGTLIFKWSEHSIPLGDVLALTPHLPLFGHRTTRSTHWCGFMKDAA